MKLRIGHSPDSDDEFMFWGLSSGKIETPFKLIHILRDIQTLNEWALEGKLECSAISAATLAFVAEKYTLIREGGSFGENYGPILVAKKPLSNEELKNAKIAIPGTLTSAFITLNCYCKEVLGSNDIDWEFYHFEEIFDAVLTGKADAGLLIHEGQLTYENMKLKKIVDLGEWWTETTSLPLPLGITVVRKDLGIENIRLLSNAIKDSINVALKCREDASEFAMQAAKGLDDAKSQTYLNMYVNKRTIDMGDEGFKAIELLLNKGHQLGLLPKANIELLDSKPINIS